MLTVYGYKLELMISVSVALSFVNCLCKCFSQLLYMPLATAGLKCVFLQLCSFCGSNILKTFLFRFGCS